jgi:hypothetical protein
MEFSFGDVLNHRTRKYFNDSNQTYCVRSITNVPWYVSNLTLHRDLQIPFVTEEIFHRISQPNNTTRKQSGYRIKQPATRQTKTKTAVALRPHSRYRRIGITAHNIISYSVYRRIITGWFLRTSVNPQHICLLLHCSLDCKFAKENKKKCC